MLTVLFHQIHTFIKVYNQYHMGWQINIPWEATPGGRKWVGHMITINESDLDTDQSYAPVDCEISCKL